MTVQPWVTLANGIKVPSPGYGTWQIPCGEETESAVRRALEAGYRHIDTAAMYANEISIGPAVQDSGINPSEIFIAGKLWNTKRGYETAIKACRQSLRRLRREYFDLYLIHWPASKKVYENWKDINSETWRAFETLYHDGLIRAIGVCNFTPEYLQALLEKAEIIPMVNQIEYHPGFMQQETVKFCGEYNIQIEAWSPLGSGKMTGRPELTALAQKYGKSAAQICIRWCLQNGTVPLPKSADPKRIKENIDLFDFEISPEDMAFINGLPYMGGSGLTPDNLDKVYPQNGGLL